MSKAATFIDLAIRAALAPELKRRGFRKRRRNFHFHDEGVVLLINVQGSVWNDDDRASAFVNLGAYFPCVARVFDHGVRNPPGLVHCQASMQLPDSFVLGSEMDVAAASSAMCESVVRDGLPWLNRFSTLKSAATQFRQAANFRCATILTFTAGEREQAQRDLARALQMGPRDDQHTLLRSWAEECQLTPRPLNT